MAGIQPFLEQALALHDHLCPRQILGIRIGLYAAELLNLSLPQSDKRLYTLVETDGCFADGVSVATGCWMGHRTMRLMDYGKVAATFYDTQTERAFRIWPHPKARQTAVCLAPTAGGHWQSQLEAYQIMTNDDLLCASAVQLNLSMKALISRPGVRTICSVCGEEILNERERIIDGQILCQSCAEESYYQPLEPILAHSS
ncbi:MAG: formylmethanofuran dehydrogenase [Anaerolineaceae bacterium]|nr:formylmethanofuran dehydrogenase [Anaerolineaceae bacterium]